MPKRVLICRLVHIVESFACIAEVHFVYGDYFFNVGAIKNAHDVGVIWRRSHDNSRGQICICARVRVQRAIRPGYEHLAGFKFSYSDVGWCVAPAKQITGMKIYSNRVDRELIGAIVSGESSSVYVIDLNKLVDVCASQFETEENFVQRLDQSASLVCDFLHQEKSGGCVGEFRLLRLHVIKEPGVVGAVLADSALHVRPNTFGDVRRGRGSLHRRGSF